MTAISEADQHEVTHVRLSAARARNDKAAARVANPKNDIASLHPIPDTRSCGKVPAAHRRVRIRGHI